MAHACDYQSRVEPKWDKKKVMLAQVAKGIIDLDREGWTERAIKEYVLKAYSSMGATESDVNQVWNFYINQ